MDYARLQQILTLKLIGLSLEQIKQLLTTNTLDLQDLLARQQRVLQEQAQQLNALINTLEKAQHALRTAPALDLEHLLNIIKAVNMHTQANWFEQFMTPEDQEKLTQLEQGWTLANQKQAATAWKALFDDIQLNLNKSVDDPIVQALVDRWDALLQQFTQGDVDLAKRLSYVHTQLDHALALEDAPQDLIDWTHKLQTAADFIQEAQARR